jgi:predicted PurR-regulated permease PerM
VSDDEAPNHLAGGAPDRDQMPRWVPQAIALFLGGVVLLVAVSWTLGRLRSLVLDVLVALFLSFALEPAVNWLQSKGWRRGLATGAAFVGLLLFMIVFLTAIGAVVVDQVTQFIDESDEYAANVAEQINDRFGTNISVEELQDELTREDGPVRGLAENLAGDVIGVATGSLGVLFRLLTIGLFTFYLVADGPRFRRAICSFLPPARQRTVLDGWEVAIDKTGGYLYSRALLALLSTAFHWVAFELIGVPYALALALFVGLVSQFVPTIGTYIAGALPVLVALADDPAEASWVLGVIVVYQQVENYVFAPRVTAHTMALHPAVAFGTVIAGAAMFGAVGALLALPAAAVLQAVGSTYVARHEVIESPMTTDRPTPRRTRRARRAASGANTGPGNGAGGRPVGGDRP